MDETEEIFISTETRRLNGLRHLGLVIFLALALVVVIASLLAAFLQA